MLSFSESFSIHPNIPTFPGLEITVAATSPDILHQPGVLPLSLVVTFKFKSLPVFIMLGYLVTSQEEYGGFIVCLFFCLVFFFSLGP